MNNPGLIKNFIAEAAIAPCRIVKFGSDDDSVAQAAAAADASIGVNGALSGEAGKRIDIVLSGVTEVEYGAAVTRGNLLTADADGKAVPAVAGNRVIGVAMVSGVAGDIGSVNIAPSIA